MTTITRSPGLRLDRVSVSSSERRSRLWRVLPNAVLLVGVLYALYPVVWLGLASTKTAAELFSTPSGIPNLSGGLWQNITELFAWNNSAFLSWCVNSLIYAGGGAVLSTLVSAISGYGLAKYRYRGRAVVMIVLISGILIPGVMLAIPQYFLMAALGLSGTHFSVILCCIVNPLGIFLAMVYAQAAVPDEVLEAGRLDGAGEFSIFARLAFVPMLPGLITVFLLQFVGIWNNFLLPYVMLTDDRTFPLTVGLSMLLNRGSTEPSLNNLAITGAFLSIIPLIVLFIVLQRYWRLDVLSGSLKG